MISAGNIYGPVSGIGNDNDGVIAETVHIRKLVLSKKSEWDAELQNNTHSCFKAH